MLRCAVVWLTLAGGGLVVAMAPVANRPQQPGSGGGWETVRRPMSSAALAVIAPPFQPDAPQTKPYRRVLPPRFDPQRVDRTFFEDVFSRTVGERPKASPPTPVDPTKTPQVPAKEPTTEEPAVGRSSLISATTLEDEVKSLKLDIDKIVTTPASFAGSGYKEARVRFAVLALLFDTIANQDSDVRWKNDAAAASMAFARVAANLKAGGSTQVYNEAKRRKQDLADLVSGARFPDPPAADIGPLPVDRTPLMQILEQRLEANLKSWTASETEFKSHVDQLVHEAELTALIGNALARPGSEDADDAEYQEFARMLEQGAMAAVAAARQQDAAGGTASGDRNQPFVHRLPRELSVRTSHSSAKPAATNSSPET